MPNAPNGTAVGSEPLGKEGPRMEKRFGVWASWIKSAGPAPSLSGTCLAPALSHPPSAREGTEE